MMRYLLDENVDPVLRRELLRRVPNIIVWRVGEPGTVPLGTLDPAILFWCEAYNAILVTNNRKSMPHHLRDHVAEGRHVPGILLLKENQGVAEIVEGLILVWGASLPDEYTDLILYLADVISS